MDWLIPIIYGAIVAVIAFASLKRKIIIAVSLFLFVLFWIAWPYHAAYNLAIAMKDGQPYALAGLWEKWKDRQTAQELLTFTIITTDPNEVVQPMHDRMPVIIPERDYDRWLKADPDRPPVDLLRPFDADKMTAWKVDRAVGNVKNDRPELIEPVSSASESAQKSAPEAPGSLFGT